MNKNPNFVKYLEIGLHVLVWLVFLGLLYQRYDREFLQIITPDRSLPYEDRVNFVQEQLNPIRRRYLRILLLIIFKAAFFYINILIILPRYEKLRPRWKIIQPLAFNLFCCVLAEFLVYYVVLKTTFSYPDYFDNWDFRYREKDAIVIFPIVLGCSFIYWASKQWLLNKENLEQLGKTNAELALLKNQVNPHFLFNTLNNLFSMAIERQAHDLAESIGQLTHLMRYSIYESRTEYIELNREVEYIENYIKLQRLRFTDDDAVSIRFNVFAENQNVRIAPMVLINFVENAFKHGVSLKQPSLINITLTTTDDQIAFTVENSIHRQNKEAHIEHAGFGLDHTKKLLDMQYPHRHQLHITEENNIYRVALILKLQKTKVEVMA